MRLLFSILFGLVAVWADFAIVHFLDIDWFHAWYGVPTLATLLYAWVGAVVGGNAFGEAVQRWLDFRSLR